MLTTGGVYPKVRLNAFLAAQCGFMHNRDVIGVTNIAMKQLIDVGHVPFAPKGVHDLHVICSHDEA